MVDVDDLEAQIEAMGGGSDDDDDDPKNADGVSYMQLLNEETKFHDSSVITAMDTLNAEIEEVIPGLLKDPNCTEDFKDELESKITMLEAHKMKIVTAFQKGKITIEEYLKVTFL